MKMTSYTFEIHLNSHSSVTIALEFTLFEIRICLNYFRGFDYLVDRAWLSHLLGYFDHVDFKYLKDFHRPLKTLLAYWIGASIF